MKHHQQLPVSLQLHRVDSWWILWLHALFFFGTLLQPSKSIREVPVQVSGHKHPVCEALAIPAVSPSYLWNTATSTLSSSSSSKRWSTARSLRTGIRTRPRWSYWKQFLDSIHQRSIDQKPIQIGMLTLPAESGMVEYWQQELLQLPVGIKNDEFTIQLKLFVEEPHCDLHLQHPCNLDDDLDLLIDARTSGFQRTHANVHSTELVLEYDTAFSRQKQSWIRRWLEKRRPVMIVLDPTIGEGLWQDMEPTRSLQLLADWYQIPFLSLAAHSSQEKHPWKLALELVLFAVLDFTILFCHGAASSTTDNQSPLLKPEAQYRAEYVLPPPLDTTLSWQDVTSQWESAHYGKEQDR